MFGGGPKEVYADLFGILTSATDDRLERWKHPKWVSLISDEALMADLRKFVLDNDCVNDGPNLTILDVVSRLKQTRNVDMSPANLE